MPRLGAWAALAAALLSACAAPGSSPRSTSAPAAAASPAAATGPAPAAAGAADRLPAYRRVPGTQGTVTLSGSSAVAAFARGWGPAFSRVYPAVNVNVVSKSSGAAIGDMIAAPSTIGMTSRPLNAGEREQFAKAHGRPPIEVRVAIDAVAIYVFKDNPMASITLPQLERIYAAAPKGGTPIEDWGDAGLEGAWKERPVVPVGFGAGRGAYEIMRDVVLRGGDFRANKVAEPVSTSVVQAVGVEPGAIGYASVFYRTARTKVLPVVDANGQATQPTEADAAGGKYPLARYLYLNFGAAQGSAEEATAREFLRFVLSQEGQDATRAQGAFAIPPALAHAQIEALRR